MKYMTEGQFEGLGNGEAVEQDTFEALQRYCGYLDFIAGLKPYHKMKELPYDCGIYLIYSNTAQYVGATTEAPKKKKNNYGLTYFTKAGIHNRIYNHKHNHTEAGDLAVAIDKGETQGAFYVLGRTIDTKTASEWERFYIKNLHPTINKTMTPKPFSRQPRAEIDANLLRVDIDPNPDGMAQSVWMWMEEEEEGKPKTMITRKDNTKEDEDEQVDLLRMLITRWIAQQRAKPQGEQVVFGYDTIKREELVTYLYTAVEHGNKYNENKEYWEDLYNEIKTIARKNKRTRQ